MRRGERRREEGGEERREERQTALLNTDLIPAHTHLVCIHDVLPLMVQNNIPATHTKALHNYTTQH